MARGETVLRAGQSADLARDRHAGGGRPRRRRGLAQAAGRDHFDRRRDRRAGRADAPRRRLRFECGDPRARRWRRSAASRSSSASVPTTRPCCRGSSTRASPMRHGAPVRRHIEGRGRSLLPRGRPLQGPGHRRARRRAEAGQADLPGGHRRQAGRHPAGLSDLGDLHLPRIRGAGDPRLRRPAAARGRAARRRRCRCASPRSAAEPSS